MTEHVPLQSPPGTKKSINFIFGPGITANFWQTRPLRVD